MSDDAGLDKIEARLDMAEKRHDILDDDLRQARDGFADMVQGVHNRVCKLEAAIKHHESGIDEHGNPLPETFADRLRHLERKVFQIESDRNPLRGFDVTCSAAPSQPPTSPPTCPHCRDTKIVGVDAFGKGHSLCPCLKVGDVVGEEAANLLPVGSRIWWEGCEWYLEKTESEWRGVGLACDFLTNMVSNNWTILRIGPGDEAKRLPQASDFTGAGAVNITNGIPSEDYIHALRSGEATATDAKPDKAPITIEPLPDDPHDYSDSPELHGYRKRCAQWIKRNRSAVEAIRKHGVGREPTLSEVLAREDMRPLVDVVKMAQQYTRFYETRIPLRNAVDALPPELRAAIEAVR